MKTLNNIVNHFTTLNSGHDIRNRSMPVKIIVVAGMITVIALTVIGVMQTNK